MPRSVSICGLILSAGFSSRMGRDKALLAWPPAALPRSGRETFLGAAIDRLERVCDLVIVVAGANAEAIGELVHRTSASLVVNPAPEMGQFSSLRIGLQQVLNHRRDAAFVSLVDRPPASEETHKALRRGFLKAIGAGAWAVAPEYAREHGHPIVIGKEMIEAMLRAPDESNAREVMRAHQERITYVAVNDPFVTMNINTAEEYERLLNNDASYKQGRITRDE